MSSTIDQIIQAVAAGATAIAVIISLADLLLARHSRSAEIKRHQAELVSAWIDSFNGEPMTQPDNNFVYEPVTLLNASDSPVYNVIVTCVGIQGAGPREHGEMNPSNYPCRYCVGTLPPGWWKIALPTRGRGMNIVFASEIAFTDARGTSWVRRGNGQLANIRPTPQDFYRLSAPYSWRGCTRAPNTDEKTHPIGDA